MTKEYFIKKATEIHDGFFNYDNVEFVDYKSKVKIVCPIHGEFLQSPREHLRIGRCGCPKCSHDKEVENRKSNLDDFIEKARLVHGDKYDYSKFVYERARNKSVIICPEHGEFLQSPDSHLRGSGCPHCKGKLRKEITQMDEFDFLSKVDDRYGNRFDLSEVEYIDYKTPVKIICKEHGPFMIAPHIFLRGQNCPECGKLAHGKPFKKTKEEFINKARKVHGDKYDYSLVEYESSKRKVKIICHEKDKMNGEEHGIFLQNPDCHIQGQGCPKCNGNKPLSDEEFIMKAKAIHGDEYDYSKSHYVNAHTPIEIICPIHGTFFQLPNKHLKDGRGCPQCQNEKK